jgi:hypothetical protein
VHHFDAISRNDYRDQDMHYKKFQVRSPLFALRDPRLSAQVLAIFSGATSKPLAPPPPRPRGAAGR